MTAAEFDRLIVELGFRLRVLRALRAVFGLAAGALVALSLAVLLAKLLPVDRPWLVSWVALLISVLVMLGAFAVEWLRRPVSELAAAAEVDRVAGLKERASALVAVRQGAVSRTAAFSALEMDAAAALAPLEHRTVLRAVLPALPERVRWLVGLGALSVVALLIPARVHRNGVSLAEMLANGGMVVAGVQAQVGGPSGPKAADERKSEVGHKVLAILKGPPPDNAAGALKQKQDLLALAEKLRKSDKPGDRALARQIEELAVQLARIAGADAAALPGGHSERNAARTARAAYLRSYPEYADLLARYFGTD